MYFEVFNIHMTIVREWKGEKEVYCCKLLTLHMSGIFWVDYDKLNMYILYPRVTTKRNIFLKREIAASLVAQWLRICLPMQGTRVWALVWKDPTCRGATGSMSHNYWACTSGAPAPQQERPQQWEARAPRWRVAPARRN